MRAKKGSMFFSGSTNPLRFQRGTYHALLAALYKEVVSENPNITLSEGSFEKEMFNTMREIVKKEASHKPFVLGKFEQLILSEDIELTSGLKKEIRKNIREFTRKLFSLCKSEQKFKAWLKEDIILPKDSFALALSSDARKFVFEYLYTSKSITGMDDEDKVDFIRRAKGKLNEEAFDYVKDVFNIQESNYKVF